VKTVQLNKTSHNRKKFDSGSQALNNFLYQMANQQSDKDNTRTYVLENTKQQGIIIGFYTLTMTRLQLNELPEKLKNKHKTCESAGLIARLAVDNKYKTKGFGQWLLIDALKKLLAASQTVAFPVVVVDAKDGAIEFYQKFGFRAFSRYPNKLFITVAEIRKNLALNNIKI
jgi:GNAT superfamily N-acetyltransferase